MTAIDPKSGDRINSVPLDLDDALEALNNHRRRFAIRWTDETEIPVDADALARHLASIENTGQLDAQDRKRVYIALTQHHLPILDDLGAVAYDDRSKTVMPSPATRKLAMLIRLLEALCRESIPESET